VIRAVVFDFFGTLTEAVRRGPAHARMADALGVTPAVLFAALDRTYPARARGEYGDGPASLARLARDLGRPVDPARLAEAEAWRLRAIRSSLRLRADALSTLTAVRAAGLGVGLVSDCTSELPGLLAELAITPLFDATVYSFALGVTKPDPLLFRTAADLLGVPPAGCLYVGDGGGRELSGAAAVGMRAIRLAAPDLVDHLSYHHDAGWDGETVPSLTAVLAVLEP